MYLTIIRNIFAFWKENLQILPQMAKNNWEQQKRGGVFNVDTLFFRFLERKSANFGQNNWEQQKEKEKTAIMRCFLGFKRENLQILRKIIRNSKREGVHLTIVRNILIFLRENLQILKNRQNYELLVQSGKIWI